MRKTLQIVLILMLGTLMLKAQTSGTETAKRVKGQPFSRNSVFVGILGQAIPLSLNYEHIWTKNGIINIGTKLGSFYSKFKKYDDLTIANGSFEVVFLAGRSKHLFEMGIGWSGYYGSYYSNNDEKTKYYGVPTSTFSMHYRFQKPTGGVFFKVGFAATSILAFGSSDLTELAIGNTFIYGLNELTGSKPSFSLLSIGIGYSFPK